MARDRLAGRTNLFQNQGSSPPSTPTPHYELSRMHRPGMSDDDFYIEISAIQDEINKLNEQIDSMARLHAQQIDAVELSGSNLSRQLEALTEETRSLTLALKRRIQTLNSQPVDERTARTRGPHIERVRTKFMDSIERFQLEEKNYRDRTKERLTRQYRIVKPEATDEEIQAVTEGGQNLQIFAQATTGRYTQAQSAYNAVRDRHEEMQRIEATLAELAQLFQDMSLLVERQGDQINAIEDQARGAKEDIEKGKVFTGKAVISALKYRKGRWICFVLCLIIVIIVAVVAACVATNKC